MNASDAALNHPYLGFAGHGGKHPAFTVRPHIGAALMAAVIGPLFVGAFASADHSCSSTTSIACGQSIAGSLNSNSETDCYQFTAATNDVVAISVGRTSGVADPCWQLFGPTGDPVSGPVCDGRDDWTIPSGGIHTVRVYDDFHDETGSYAISLERLGGDASCSEALTCGSTVQRATEVEGDIDSFTFAADANQAVTISIGKTGGETFYEPCWQLHDPNGIPLTSNVCLAAEDWVLAQPGRYTVVVSENGHDQTGTYALSFEVLSAGSRNCAEPIQCGKTLQRSLEIRGDIDTFRFDAVAGQVMSIGLPRDPICWRIFKPDGTPLSVRTCGTGAEWVLPTNGAYTIQVAGESSSETGDYNLSLEVLSASGNCAERISCADVFQRTITPVGDVDTFAFGILAGTEATITLTSNGGFGFSPCWELFGPDGAGIGTSRCSSPGTESLLNAGLYTVKVYDDSYDTTGTYSIDVDLSGGCPATTTTSTSSSTSVITSTSSTSTGSGTVTSTSSSLPSTSTTTTPPTSCARPTERFTWPVTGAEIGQDYAQYDLQDGTVFSDNQHHTGVDIPAAAGTPVQAAARGRVVLIQKVKAAGEDRDHGYGNTVILHHQGSGLYTQYSHLQSIDERLVTGCEAQQVFTSTCPRGVDVDPNDPAKSTVGTVGASASGESPAPGVGPHLHFELKRFPTLGTSDDEFGYTPGHPDTYGYCDPLTAYHDNSDTLALPSGTRVRVTEGGCGASLRVGPGALPNGIEHRTLKSTTTPLSPCDAQFRTSVIGAIQTGDLLEVRGTAGKTTDPLCDGWYRVESVQPSHNTDAIGTAHYFRDASRPKITGAGLSTTPDAWVCAGQNRQCITGRESTCWLSPISPSVAITVPGVDSNRETVKKAISIVCGILSQITLTPKIFCEAVGFAAIPESLSDQHALQSQQADGELPPPMLTEVTSKVRKKINKLGRAKFKVKLNKQGRKLLKARGGSLTMLLKIAVVDTHGRTVPDESGRPMTTEELVTIKRP